VSLPKYPEYKASGLAWLGEVPTHWTATPLKRVANVQTGIAKGKDNEGKGTIAVPYLRVANVQDGHLALDDVATIEVPPEAIARYRLQPGDVLMNEGGDFDKLGRGCIWRGEIAQCIHQNHVFAVRPHSVSSQWLNWLTSSGYAQFYFMSRSKQSTNLASISSSNIMELPLLIPPGPEQALLVAFLDRETAKIDALIAEQEKLIALLAEKRQATISHAVSRGLDSDVPMKDSGLAWLGEVPRHWTVKRLKHISPSMTVGIVVNPSDYVSEFGLPFIYGGDIREGEIDIEGCRRIAPDDSARQPKTQLRSGDLLTVRVGAPGVTAVVPESCSGGNCASVMLIRAGDFDSEWLCFAMNSRVLRYQVEVVQYGAAQEQFNISHAVNFWVPTPPREEQQTIGAYLKAEIGRLAALEKEAALAIELLRERRSALITAAVTGQIDVRGTVQAAPASPESLPA